MRKRRSSIVGSFVVCLFALLASCGDDATTAATTTVPAPTASAGGSTTTAKSNAEWLATLDAANKEGTVVFYYATLEAQANDLIAGFQSAYPKIKVSATRISPNMVEKLEAERTTGAAGADVANLTDFAYLTTLQNNGSLLPITAPSLEAWKGSANLMGNTAFVSHTSLHGLAWNTDLAKTPLTSYKDLLRPEFANGKLGVVVARIGGLADSWLWLEKNFGEQYIKDLAAQKPRFYESQTPMDQALVSGEIAAEMRGVPPILDQKAKGAPVNYFQPIPASGLNIGMFGVKWAKHPNAAQVFLDYVLSQDGQKILGKVDTPGLAGVPGALDASKVTPVRGTAAEQQAFVTKWNTIFGR